MLRPDAQCAADVAAVCSPFGSGVCAGDGSVRGHQPAGASRSSFSAPAGTFAGAARFAPGRCGCAASSPGRVGAVAGSAFPLPTAASGLADGLPVLEAGAERADDDAHRAGQRSAGGVVAEPVSQRPCLPPILPLGCVLRHDTRRRLRPAARDRRRTTRCLGQTGTSAGELRPLGCVPLAGPSAVGETGKTEGERSTDEQQRRRDAPGTPP
jgi:hypothetical protein